MQLECDCSAINYSTKTKWNIFLEMLIHFVESKGLINTLVTSSASTPTLAFELHHSNDIFFQRWQQDSYWYHIYISLRNVFVQQQCLSLSTDAATLPKLSHNICSTRIWTIYEVGASYSCSVIFILTDTSCWD